MKPEEMLIDGLTIDQLIERETKEQTVSLWGQKCTFTPVMVSEKHGDGLQVVYLSSIDTRPLYWLLCIDSSIDLSDNDSMNNEDRSTYGTIDELLVQMVEHEYGNIDSYEAMEDGRYYDPDDPSADPFEYEYPMMCWGGGSWGLIANFKTGEKANR